MKSIIKWNFNSTPYDQGGPFDHWCMSARTCLLYIFVFKLDYFFYIELDIKIAILSQNKKSKCNGVFHYIWDIEIMSEQKKITSMYFISIWLPSCDCTT